MHDCTGDSTLDVHKSRANLEKNGILAFRKFAPLTLARRIEAFAAL